MFRIREFSGFARVSVKMLRHYDRLGLLQPAHVDARTRYRYYSARQLGRLNRIIALKDLGFPLARIKALLDRSLGARELRRLLNARRAELEREAEDTRRKVSQLDAHLAILDEVRGRDSTRIVVRPISGVRVATARARLPDLDRSVEQLFEALEASVMRAKARAFGSPMLIYHDAEYRESQADVEAVVPIKTARTLSDNGPREGLVRVRDLPAVPSAACLVYEGHYGHLRAALGALMRWIEAHRLDRAGPMREVYRQFGARHAAVPSPFLASTPAEYVTEIQVPVRPRS